MPCNYNISLNAVSAAQTKGRVDVQVGRGEIKNIAKYNMFIGFFAHLFGLAIKCKYTENNKSRVCYVNANSFAKRCDDASLVKGKLHSLVKAVKEAEAAKTSKMQDKVIRKYREKLAVQLKKAYRDPQTRQAQFKYFIAMCAEVKRENPKVSTPEAFVELLQHRMYYGTIEKEGNIPSTLHLFAGFVRDENPPVTDFEHNIFGKVPPTHHPRVVEVDTSEEEFDDSSSEEPAQKQVDVPPTVQTLNIKGVDQLELDALKEKSNRVKLQLANTPLKPKNAPHVSDDEDEASAEESEGSPRQGVNPQIIWPIKFQPIPPVEFPKEPPVEFRDSQKHLMQIATGYRDKLMLPGDQLEYFDGTCRLVLHRHKMDLVMLSGKEFVDLVKTEMKISAGKPEDYKLHLY